MTLNRALTLVFLATIILFGAWLRYPRIGEGLPFLYREDEAHHFNRIVNMVKSGDLNPHYFHKPSLHFYLRMPVVAAGFIWGVREGHLRSIKEINTKDPYGVADYAFSASHPGIVKWNRAFSVALSLAIILLVFFITRLLSSSDCAALTAAFITTISPAFVEDSAVIGVDIVMAFFCLLTTASALCLFKKYSLTNLAITGFLAGLAISSKYNALPIVCLPLLSCMFLSPSSSSAWLIACITPILGFFVGSPYILSSIPLFLDQLAYEVWHYGVAVHEGHSAEPGIAQALFYAKWLHHDGLGVAASSLGIVGAIVLLCKNQRQHILLLAFPILFSILMIFQKTNFTRNMLVIIPYVSISACVTLGLILNSLRSRGPIRAAVFSCFALVASMLPLQRTFMQRAQAESVTDSRLTAIKWLQEQSDGKESIAIVGQLQFPLSTYRLPSVSRVDLEKLSIPDLWQAGFSRLLVPKTFILSEQDPALASLEQSFSGSNESLRIVQDPPMSVYRIESSEAAQQKIRAGLDESKPASMTLRLQSDVSQISNRWSLSCQDKQSNEDYCWFTSRVSSLKVETPIQDSGLSDINLLIHSPWEQEIVFSAGNWQNRFTLKPGVPQAVTISPPWSDLSMGKNSISVYCPEIHSPRERGLNSDDRRLGAAVSLNTITPNKEVTSP